MNCTVPIVLPHAQGYTARCAQCGYQDMPAIYDDGTRLIEWVCYKCDCITFIDMLIALGTVRA